MLPKDINCVCKDVDDWETRGDVSGVADVVVRDVPPCPAAPVGRPEPRTVQLRARAAGLTSYASSYPSPVRARAEPQRIKSEFIANTTKYMCTRR